MPEIAAYSPPIRTRLRTTGSGMALKGFVLRQSLHLNTPRSPMGRIPISRTLAAVLFVTLLGAFPCAAQDSSSLLSPVFQDRVVLQRDTTVRIWGTAPPGETLTVTVAGQRAEAQAAPDGAWSARLPALPDGGPHRLVARASGGAVQIVTGVQVGDVYLCSGQSNMALPVRRTLDAPSEIQRAGNERIRMLTVPQVSSPTPVQTLPGSVEWEVASSETVADWSATCYYFARSLQSTVDVPIGLIHSSWGGSKIRAWMSTGTLDSLGGHDRMLSLLDRYTNDRRAAQRAFGERWEAWWRTAGNDAEGEEPWRPSVGTDWPRAPEGLGNWVEWEGMEGFHGMVWFRAVVELTSAQAQRGAVLSLGPIDEIDQTWINGHVVSNTSGWSTERTYAVPPEHLQAGKNVVVVNVLNTYGAGGLLDVPSGHRALVTGTGDRLALKDWRYRKVPPEVGTPPRTPWQSTGGLSTLHNGMVAPLRDYSLRGVVWYQGESDTGPPKAYQAKLDALMAQWRDLFGANVPVLVVQLANYGSVPTEPTESNWAELREAQRLTVRDDPNAALAVTIDIGTSYDIHPPNKQEVGRRLTRAARHVVYGAEVPPSGPVPVRAARRDVQKGQVTVTFEGVQDRLVARGHTAPIGFELCSDEPEGCHYADAEIDGRQVHLRVEMERPATRVRYCWADSPVCTLYDRAGWPAGPFEVDVTAE